MRRLRPRLHIDNSSDITTGLFVCFSSCFSSLSDVFSLSAVSSLPSSLFLLLLQIFSG